jgi:hypothetical protein
MKVGLAVVGSVRLPRAVAFSLYSSESEPASYSCLVSLMGKPARCSFELVITRSDSLSLSSYSSWLLVPVCLVSMVMYDVPGALRRRRGMASCWTRSPVVTISSPMEEREEEEGWEDISTQESDRWLIGKTVFSGWGAYMPSFRNR